MRAPKMEGRGKAAKQVGWQKTNLWVVDLVVPESIEEMMTRLRERQAVLAPNGAATAIYGPSAHLPALEPGPPAATAPPPAEASPEPHPGKAKATEATARSLPPVEGSPSAAPEDDEPALEGEIVDGDLEAAGAAVVPDGFAAAGQSLAEVAENATGPLWLQWALETPGRFDAEFNEALDTFMSLRFPEVYASVKGGS
jgi:hypothetical protein